MSYNYTHVKRYKRGATWPDGQTRTCTLCRSEKNRGLRKRAQAASVVALMKYSGSRFKLPVGYCDEHTPDRLEEE